MLNILKLQDATKTWISRCLAVQMQLKRRPAAVNAGSSYSSMVNVTISSSTATGRATVRDLATRQGTTGSTTSTFIRWLKFSTMVYSLLYHICVLSSVAFCPTDKKKLFMTMTLSFITRIIHRQNGLFCKCVLVLLCECQTMHINTTRIHILGFWILEIRAVEKMLVRFVAHPFSQ